MNDITERQRLEELLRRHGQLASIGRLAAGIAHEINNAVGGILMAAEYAGGALGRDDGDSIVRKGAGRHRGRCQALPQDRPRVAAVGAPGDGGTA